MLFRICASRHISRHVAHCVVAAYVVGPTGSLGCHYRRVAWRLKKNGVTHFLVSPISVGAFAAS